MTTTTSDPARVLEFERCFNFRDLGGYRGQGRRRVRWRRLFRSMTPEYMSDADVEQARGLGIGLVVDLRGRRFHSGPLGDPPARRITVGSRRSWRWKPEEVQRFREASPEVALPWVMDRLGRSFAKAVSAMAETDEPVLFHCRLGKDRSGILAALMLKLLGVSDEEVIADYVLSGDAAALAAPIVSENGDDPTQSASRVVREAAGRTVIRALLDHLERRYGGAYAYFRRHGVAKYKLERLIERLLEPVADG